MLMKLGKVVKHQERRKMIDKYKYGIFYKINKTNGWNERQIKIYMDKQGIKYNSDDTKEQLVEAIKNASN